MKQFTRLFSMMLVFVFMAGIALSQNPMRFQTKAQSLGLKTTQIHHYQQKQVTNFRTTLLEEGFDSAGVFPPTDWSTIINNADNTWQQGNPSGNNFNQIDPNSLFSAVVPWVATDQDEWLITPSLDAAGEVPLKVNFYAGVSGTWLSSATLKCLISTDNGNTWTELWNALGQIDSTADWGWNYVSLDISSYANAPFQIAWEYVGNNGDLAALDGVEVKAGYTYLFQDDFESYNVGDYLALNSDTWTTWNHAPGTDEDAFVVNTQSASPTKSVEVVGSTTDLILPLQNKTSGKYQIDMKYYIVNGYGGYFNIQHYQQPGIEWAYEVYFGANGEGYMNAQGNNSAFFTFNHDEWLNLKSIIDLDIDTAWFYINDTLIYQWKFSTQANGDPGTLQIGGMDCFAGAPTGDTAHYFMDDVDYIELIPGITTPIINVDSSAITATLEQDQSTTATVTIGNDGQEDLDYQIVVTYPNGNKALNQEPAGTHTPKSLFEQITKAPSMVVASSGPAGNRNTVLHYDGDYFTAIGANTDYEWRVAAKFPSNIIQPYIGMEISSVDVYTKDQGTAFKLQIYGMGSYITPGPGNLLLEQTFTALPDNWTTVVLNTPIYIDGQSLWVGYWFQASAGTFVPGCDDGTNYNTNGDWLANGPGWGHLSDNPDLKYNWNIRANLTGDPIVQWLSADPAVDTLANGESQDVTVTLDATNLTSNIYSGTLDIRNNDPNNALVTIPVSLSVVVGINENTVNEYVVMYPNPAKDYLRIGSNGKIKHVTISNTVGQIIYNQTMNVGVKTINTTNYENGIYFVTVDTDNGTTTQKIIIK